MIRSTLTVAAILVVSAVAFGASVFASAGVFSINNTDDTESGSATTSETTHDGNPVSAAEEPGAT